MIRGVIYGSTDNIYIESKIEWTAEADYEANESTLHASLYYRRTNNYVTNRNGTFSLKADQQTVTQYAVVNIVPESWGNPVMEADFVIEHEADGTKQVVLSASGTTDGALKTTNCSGVVQLETIEKATQIDTAADVILGQPGLVSWNARDPAHTFQLSYTAGGKTLRSELIAHGVAGQIDYRGIVPLELAEGIPEVSGELTLVLDTYDGERHLGASEPVTVIATVPQNEQTMPTLSFECTYENGFKDMLLQQISSVTMQANAEAKLGATIEETLYFLNGAQLSGNSTGLLVTPGDAELSCRVIDSRGFAAEAKQTITVTAYSLPRIINVNVYRCDVLGQENDEGTYLRIQAERQYNSLGDDNKCQIWYEIPGFQERTVILSGEAAGNQVLTDPMLDGKLSNNTDYSVTVGVTDSAGGSNDTAILVPKTAVHDHIAPDGWGFGGMCGPAGGMDVHWETRFRGQVYLVKDGQEISLENYIKSLIGG